MAEVLIPEPRPLADATLEEESPRAAAPARRSLWAFAMVAAGFAAARATPGVPAAAWFSAACAVLIAAVLGRGWRARVALAMATAMAGGGWFAMRIHEAPRDHLSALVVGVRRDGRVLAVLEGTVAEPPTVRAGAGPGTLAEFSAGAREPSVAIVLDVDGVAEAGGLRPASGRVRVWVEAARAPEGVRAGARIQVAGEFSPVGAPLNPGSPDRRMLAAQEPGGGIAGDLAVPGPALVRPLPRAPGVGAWLRSARATVLGSLRSGAREALDAAVPDGAEGDAGPLLRALLLGEYEPAGQDLTDAFTRQGLVHLLAISGFHLVIVAGAVGFLVRLTGERGGLEAATVAGLVGLYMLIVPAEAPVLRAGLMVLTLLAAEAAGRRYDRLTVLGWVCTGLILWRPMDLWSLGFQLSAGIVAVLLWLGRTWHARLWGVPLRGTVDPYRRVPLVRWLRWAWGMVKGAVSASILCWAVAAPLIAHHTGIVSPVAMVTGVVLVPVVTLMLVAGYAALVLGAVVPAAAPWVGEVLAWLAGGLGAAVRALDHWEATSVALPAISGAWAAAATAAVLYAVRRGRRDDRIVWVMGAALAAWLAAEVLVRPGVSWRGAARIDTLAVGDGACHVVRCGRGLDGEGALLWDCGSLKPGLGVRELPRAVRALGVWRIRTAVVTHANYDHFSALPDMVRPLGIRRVLVTPAMVGEADANPAGGAAALLRELRARGVEVRAVSEGERLEIGGASVEFLWPPAPGSPGAPARLAANDTSLVARITAETRAGPRSILLTGDIGRAALAVLLARETELAAAVVEAPHHGSYNDAAAAFIRAAAPEVVLQSTGPRRAGDRRWDAVRAGRAWLTTATDGASWAEIRRDGSVARGSRVARDAVSGTGVR